MMERDTVAQSVAARAPARRSTWRWATPRKSSPSATTSRREAQDEYVARQPAAHRARAAGRLLRRRARADAGHARDSRQEDRREDRRGGRRSSSATSAIAPTRRSKGWRSCRRCSTRRAARAASPPATRRSCPTARRPRSSCRATRAQALGAEAAARLPRLRRRRLRARRDGHRPGVRRAEAARRSTGLRVDDIDVWELNEAFASQVVYCRDRLGIPMDRLNPTAARSPSATRSA